MSNITGDGGSLSSAGTNAGEDEVHNQSHLFYDPSSAITGNSDISAASQLPQLQLPVKKKRNLPGTPDPNAEVIALSPKTLMATNRFVCEICHKGFQRDQNLQLHRRGHNLPWKLRQRSSSETRKRVYICPEPTCVHHNPSRALGDLTGIKKHYCRKHGEKKWKCDKCSKKYAVQSDWKAHSKVCGTREYKCDCGTIFSRRDSFITHRAFCDALAQENNKLNQPLMATMASSLQGQASSALIMPIQHTTTATSAASVPELGSHVNMKSPAPVKAFADQLLPASSCLPSPSGMLSSFFSIPSPSSSCLQPNNGPMGFSGLTEAAAHSAQMSATALLQKAAQIGATASGNSIAGSLMQKGLASMMAGPDRVSGMRAGYGPMKAHGQSPPSPYQLLSQAEHVQLVENQFYNASAMNDMSGFTASGMMVSDAGDGGLKQMTRCGSGDVMTVDFLGVGGERRLHMQQQQQGVEFGGVQSKRMESLHALQQQMAHGRTEMEKPMWDV
ncbi:hypothetical protein Cni_G19106 [Canna indica]|uniref:Protein EARLY HEADING DATE 2 n=1 Tax=Canna indica TaxID=4628 RepID=A0AAQ3QI82_9LILI|nr:hypothetical protein Cni_G19106 [Canna indica]